MVEEKLAIHMGPLKVVKTKMVRKGSGFKYSCINQEYSALSPEDKKHFYLKVFYALNQVFSKYNVRVAISETGEVSADIFAREEVVI